MPFTTISLQRQTMTKTDMTENNSDKKGTKNPENGDSTACEEQRQKSRRARISPQH